MNNKQTKINKTNKAGIYLHIPFCISKCEYCDFVSYPCVGSADEFAKEYCDAILQDIQNKAKKHSLPLVDTIYFGGGTPSILSACEIEKLLSEVKSNFQVCKNAEITIEVNPKTVDKEKLLRYKNMGINRVSVGVQSFEDSQLSAVSRAHSGEEAKEVLAWVAEIFENFSVDLMLGLPTSNMSSVFSSVKTALSFSPQHISLYGLQVEEGTPLFQKVQNGLVLPREDIVADMFELAENLLRDAGFVHYEISNFAKEGKESKHNMGYWKLKDYLGVGVSAHSLVGEARFFAPNEIGEYIKAVKNGNAEIFESSLTIEEAEKEYIMLGLRLKNGVDTAEFQNVFGIDFAKKYSTQMEKFKDCMNVAENSVSIKEEYFYVSNQIISEFM